MKLSGTNFVYRIFCGAFLAFAVFCLGRYLHYISAVVAFPYDWEATDGDHLNFAHRIAQGMPIYLSMKAGQVLSIYNPLYHGLVALVGGADAGMSLARFISLAFWLLCPLTVLAYYFKRWGYFYSTVAAIFILLPSEPMLLMDIVQVSPSSTMAFFFLGTLLLAEYCMESSRVPWKIWILVGAMAALCFLAKQQGIVAIGIVMTCLIAKQVGIKKMSLVLIGFFLVFATACVYLEWVNSGLYLRSTIIDLKHIMSMDPDIAQPLAKARLYAFLFQNNAAFTVCVLLSLVFVVLRMIKLSIWQVSFLAHLFFLFKILGNGGGGQNYFLTMWISMVLVGVGMISRFVTGHKEISSPYFQIAENQQVYLSSFGRILLLGLFINSSIGGNSINRQITASIHPSVALEGLMKDYYQAVGALVSTKVAAKVLTNRNIGALVANNVNVENEGSTMFQYAWFHGDTFTSSAVLSSIRHREYDFIVTGVQNYPPSVSAEVMSNYKVALAHGQILNLGKVGLSAIYIPK